MKRTGLLCWSQLSCNVFAGFSRNISFKANLFTSKENLNLSHNVPHCFLQKICLSWFWHLLFLHVIVNWIIFVMNSAIRAILMRTRMMAWNFSKRYFSCNATGYLFWRTDINYYCSNAHLIRYWCLAILSRRKKYILLSGKNPQQSNTSGNIKLPTSVSDDLSGWRIAS